MTAANLAASSGSPITPVEARNTSLGRQPRALAAKAAVIFVASRPFFPVNALALPEFTTRARAAPPASRARHHSTGADAQRDRVKTPATAVPLSKAASSTSARPR